MGNLYGYVRVSTREQNEDRQLITDEGQKPPFQDKKGPAKHGQFFKILVK